MRTPRRPRRSCWTTDDPLHGSQEGRFFHGYYGCYCYLPLYVFCGDHLLVAKLRRANTDASAGAVGEAAQIVTQIRARWPEVRIVLRADSGYTPPFELIDYMTLVEHRQGRGMVAEASVKLRVNGEIVHTAAEGNGPVNAMDIATRKALTYFFPALADFSLVDYKVRILDGHAATGATTRVLIETANHKRRWSTVGASTNIIDASWLALQDAIEYGVMVAAQDQKA